MCTKKKDWYRTNYTNPNINIIINLYCNCTATTLSLKGKYSTYMKIYGLKEPIIIICYSKYLAY